MYQLNFVALLGLALLAGEANAEDANPGTFSISGFGTLSLVHSSENQADFRSSQFKPKGAGYSRSLSGDVDSIFALQVGASLTPQLSAVLQVISEQNFDNSYQPHVEWANIKYQVTQDLTVRLGRTALPVFMLSDSRHVGYANPWVRPPLEVYNLVSVTSNDGLDASYRLPVGAGVNTIQINAGGSDSKFPASVGLGAGTAKTRQQLTVANTFEQGFATVRVNYGQSRITLAQLNPLFDAFRQFGPQGVALADKYDVNRRLVTFVGLGANYDPGKWFVMGEWGRIDTQSVLGKNSGWYISSGLRAGQFTPYVTYGQLRKNSATSDPGLAAGTFPASATASVNALNGALNSILGQAVIQNTISVGGRWDFMKNAALKVQIDHSRHGPGSAGTLVNLQPGFQSGRGVTVFSATIDFVL